MRAPIKNLHELARFRDEIKVRAEQELAEKQRQEAEQKAAQKEASIFRNNIGAVTPIKAPDVHIPTRQTGLATKPASAHSGRGANSPEITSMDQVMEQWSDEFDASLSRDEDDTLSYTRPGVGADVITRLRKGQWKTQAHLDLHGLQRDQARTTLADFLQRARYSRFRCVCIIHGKGLNSKTPPILPGKVRSWLCQSEWVQAFCQANPEDGGAGAVLVLLKAES